MIAHLTGSHFFGTAQPGSDIDFFAEDSDEARVLLRRLGFQQLTFSLHPLANTTAVFWRADLRLHVQLVRDVELKERVQRNMRDAGLAELLKHKGAAIRMWLFAYRYAAEMESKYGRTQRA